MADKWYLERGATFATFVGKFDAFDAIASKQRDDELPAHLRMPVRAPREVNPFLVASGGRTCEDDPTRFTDPVWHLQTAASELAEEFDYKLAPIATPEQWAKAAEKVRALVQQGSDLKEAAQDVVWAAYQWERDGKSKTFAYSLVYCDVFDSMPDHKRPGSEAQKRYQEREATRAFW